MPIPLTQALAIKRLSKKAKRGFRGFPVATIAYYGPDDRRATKVAVGIVHAEDQEATELKRWVSTDGDVRRDPVIALDILAFIERHEPKSVVMTSGIIGCPHEEGIDYEGTTCPMCPFWAGRDRFTGKVIH